jgi:hypothetical protein
MFVRVGGLERYLEKYNPNVPMLIGEIIHHSKVSRSGKWAEDFESYPHDFYPLWPKGSAGHVCSRAAIKYFSDMSASLHRFQGEDTSIGIWLDEARKSKALKNVVYIHAKNMFESHGKDACQRHKYMIVGHDLRPDEILECHNKFPYDFPEVAWLDDPSEFEEMIRKEGPYSQDQGFEGWKPVDRYNMEGLTSPALKAGSSFGYRGIIS